MVAAQGVSAVLRVVWSQVLRRRGRSLAVVAAIVVAAVSFSLLTSSVATSRLRVQGTVEENFRSAYDILVRPAGSKTPLEASERLVQENYLSGIFGGITRRQYQRIAGLPGVEVAAPVAMVGYTLPIVDVPYTVNQLVDKGASQQVLRVDLHWASDRGLSSYSEQTRFLYVTDQATPRVNGIESQTDPVTGRPVRVCQSFNERQPSARSAFDYRRISGMVCFSTETPGPPVLERLHRGDIGINFFYPFPLLIAAVDPQAEAELVGLDDAVTEGRYLTESDRIRTRAANPSDPESLRYRQIPMLISQDLVSDENLQVQVSRVDVGEQDQVPSRLAAPGALRWLQKRPSTVVRRTPMRGEPLYQQLLDTYSRHDVTQFPAQYWSAGQVSYQRGADGHLLPQQGHNDKYTWTDTRQGFYAPAEAADVAFRKLQAHAASNQIYGNTLAAPVPRVVGRFDPDQILGFSGLSKVPLTTYYPPSAAPGDDRTDRLLEGRPLLPNNNLAGYLQQPPLLLTNLRSMGAFTDTQAFTDVADTKRAPISVIRVRVAGVNGPDDLSRERVRLVAEQIARQTGLDVDITIGTSPTPELVDLPAGNHGRPALTLKEGWVKKGVSVQLLNAIDTKSLGLFLLVLVVCALFLLNATLAAVRSRSAELGILSCLGWSRRRIFWLLEAELLTVGLIAGLIGTAVAALLITTLDLHIAWPQLLLITPVAVLLAGLSGAGPIRRASRTAPLQAITPAVRPPRRPIPVTSITRLALVAVARTPGRTLLGALSLLIGVSALAALLAIQQKFSGGAVGTLLGDAIAIDVRGVDVFAVALTLALGAFSIADIAYLNITERRAEIGTLRATGWTDNHVRRLFATEALAAAALGAILGAALGVTATGILLSVDAADLARAAALAAVGGIAVAAIALTIPATRLSRLAPAATITQE